MADGQWMGHEPDTYRYNGYGGMDNYPGSDAYRAPPTMNSHMNGYDYSMMHNGSQHQHQSKTMTVQNILGIYFEIEQV